MRPTIALEPTHRRGACNRAGTAGRRASRGQLGRCGSFEPSAVTVAAACERSDDSPSAPSCPSRCAPLGELAGNLRWSWHPETQDLFARRRPRRCGSERGHDPVRLLGAVGREPARASWPRTSDFLRAAAAAARRPRGLPRPATAGTSARPAPTAPRAIAYFSPGVRHHRGAAAVLRRPRHPRRRPPQGRQRPRRPDHRRRPALPARLLPRSRCPARAGSRSPTRSSTPTGCRSALLREADGTAADGRDRRCPAAATLHAPGSGSPRSAACRCCCSTPTSRRTRRPSATSPTGSTAATASTGCARRCCSASAASARCARTRRLTGAPAPEVFHTNEGHAGFLGLERIRELDRGRTA